jgi:hypothetical protein
MFFQIRISHVLPLISICELFTDSPPYIDICCIANINLESIAKNVNIVILNKCLIFDLCKMHTFQ